MIELKIWWENGYTDLLDMSQFARATGSKQKHKIQRPSGGHYSAYYRLHTDGKHATLTYEKQPDVYPGVMKIVFEDDARAKVSKVLWKEEGSEKFEDLGLRIRVGEA